MSCQQKKRESELVCQRNVHEAQQQ